MSCQAELDNGAGVEALRRFNKALRAIPADKWGEALLRWQPAAKQEVLLHGCVCRHPQVAVQTV
jgi:hypothetical protein